jgi:hypothetical protein
VFKLPYQFPPTAPTLTGDVLQINRFLNDPTWVMRALRTIGDQMFVSDRIFTTQLFSDSGSFVYQQNETIFADRVPAAVPPGGEYPLTPISTGLAQTANTVKWGQDTLFEDEAISRQKFPVLTRGLTKLSNSHVQLVDSVFLAAAASAVTQNTNALASWAGTGSAPSILRDLMRATAKILGLKQGYKPNAVLVGLDTFANVVSDDKLALLLPREYPGSESTPVREGLDSALARTIGGFTFITSPNLPVTGKAMVLDTSVFGAAGNEVLPEIGYATDDNGTQVKTMRQDETDGWRVRARRVTVPIVLEPASAWLINGVDA